MKQLVAIMLALIIAALGIGYASETDEIAELKAEIARLEAENARLNEIIASYSDPSVIVYFNGGSVKFQQVYAGYLEVAAFYREFYEAMGFEYEEDYEDALNIQKQIAQNLADEAIINNYLAEHGITLISAKEEAQIKAEAQAQYEEIYAEVLSFFVNEGYGSSDAALLTNQYMLENGFDLDTLIQDAMDEAESQALIELFTADVTVDEADIEQAYQEKLAYETELYTELPEEFAFDSLYSDSPIAFIPEGYRIARMVIIPFDDEAMAAYDELFLQDNTDSPEADKLYNALQPEADAVYNRLISGESFDAIRKEYPDTEYYMDEFGSDTGFYISQSSYIFDEETTKAIMSLMTVGSVTRPIRNDWGYAIFEYAGDVESGIVPLSEMRSEIAEIALSDKINRIYTEAIENLRQEAGVIYFFDRLN